MNENYTMEKDRQELHDDLSAMAWEVAVKGKNGREIAALHEEWAAALQSGRDDFDQAQVAKCRPSVVS